MDYMFILGRRVAVLMIWCLAVYDVVLCRFVVLMICQSVTSTYVEVGPSGEENIFRANASPILYRVG